MGWFKTLAGGAIGFAITGGPLGAVLGAMAADAMFGGRRPAPAPRRGPRAPPQPRRRC